MTFRPLIAFLGLHF